MSADDDNGKIAPLMKHVAAGPGSCDPIPPRIAKVVGAPPARLTSPVLVGRERELRALLDVASHPPAFSLVEGEAGVGKTRLVQELSVAPELRGRRCYVGGCQQLAEPFPLGPVIDALRNARPSPSRVTRLAGALRPLLPELSSILPAPPEPLGDPRAERHRLFRALREFLDALGPAVLVLEDLHWADDTTMELLRFLVPQLPPELAIVGTYRREDLSEASPLLGLPARLASGAGGGVVMLPALDRSQVRQLARTILELDEVSDEFADYLFDGSGGLPFAVEELLCLLESRKDLVRRHGLWIRRDLDQMGVPRALRDSILERMGRLRSASVAVVRAAAVLGLPADEQLLARVAGVRADRVGQALTEALSSALLLEVDQSRYGFRHVLARQAVEEAIPAPLRRGLHRRAASALARVRPEPLARLAHHCRAAGKIRAWIRYAEAAADRADSLEDDATAYRFLKEAVAVPDLPAHTRARLAIKLARHARHCLAHKEAIELLRPLLADGLMPTATRGELRMWLVRLLLLDGDAAAWQAEGMLAVDELKRRPAQAAQAMVFLLLNALLWAPDGRVDEQRDWLDQAAHKAARSDDRIARLWVAGDRAAYLTLTGDRRSWQAVEEIPRPGPSSDEVKRAMRVHNNLADAALHIGHYRRAEELLRESRRLAGPDGALALRSTELQLRWLVGDWDGLEEQARSHVEAWGDWEVLQADVHAVLGLLLLARGDMHSALGLLRPLAEDFRGEAPVLAWVAGALARIRLAEGSSQAAIHEAARALDGIERKNVWVWATDVAPVSVEALLVADRQSDAADLTDRFAEGLQGRDAPAASAALTICRGLFAQACGDRAAAADTYLNAEQAWLALPRPYQAAQARERAGRCLLPDKRGQALLGDAMDAFRALGATWDAARVRRRLREHGAIPPHRRGRRGYGLQLTPRETEVAKLASQGLSNREIGLALFLSKKTVEGHLHSTMRKLGVTSRAELAGRLPAPAALVSAAE